MKVLAAHNCSKV